MGKYQRLIIGVLVVASIAVLAVGGSYLQAMYLRNDSWTAKAGDGRYEFYPTAAQMEPILQSLVQQYPQLVGMEAIGQSLTGQPIYCLTVAGDGAVAPDQRPALFVFAAQHAREAISSQVGLYAIEDLLQRHDDEPLVQHLLSTRTIYLVPQVNPDGNDIWLNVDSLHRGNARPADLDGDGKLSEDGPDDTGVDYRQRHMTQFTSNWITTSGGDLFGSGYSERDEEGDFVHFLNDKPPVDVDRFGRTIEQLDNDGDGKVNEDDLIGVDLNRNWDADWEQGLADPSSYVYRGVAAWSEPETAALRDFVLAHRNIVTALDLHSGVEAVLMPWAKTTDLPPDATVLDEIGRKGSELTQVPHTYTSQGLYPSFGNCIDWLYSQGIIALAAEVYQGQAPSYTAIHRLWPTNWYAAYWTSAAYSNPSADRIVETAQRWQGFVQYLAAILPEPYLASAELNDGTLSVDVGNAGFLTSRVAVELWHGDKKIFSQQLADQSEQGIPLRIPGIADGSYRLTVSVQPQLTMASAATSIRQLSFNVNAGMSTDLGAFQASPSLSSLFGGFTAPADFYETEEWHLPLRKPLAP